MLQRIKIWQPGDAGLAREHNWQSDDAVQAKGHLHEPYRTEGNRSSDFWQGRTALALRLDSAEEGLHLPYLRVSVLKLVQNTHASACDACLSQNLG